MKNNVLTLLGFLLACCTACQEETRLFRLLPPEDSGLDFVNRITETDTFNILTEEYIYNGGGVAVADFNQDGLQDLYFTGNQVGNKIYLNRGNMTFEDVSAVAGATGEGRWCSGVTIVDINQDTWPDLYVAVTMNKDPEKRRNLLYIHQGLNSEGIPTFVEAATQYGLDDTGNTHHAVFFDYDRDGDLDAYLLTNVIDKGIPSSYHNKITDGSAANTDRLYRNNGNGTFTDVSKEAGITIEGFGLGVAVSDINLDGWPDLYITNDYISNDLLYINNQDGTFTNQLEAYTQHQSHSAMGNDVVDFNNDGLVDIFALDMLPEDNQRKKKMLANNDYINHEYNDQYGYQYQVIRNTLQLNRGLTPEGRPVFSEVGQLANLYQTDWSWAPLVCDFDNDGRRDLYITNGFPRDVTDKDFALFMAGPAGRLAEYWYLLDSIPIVKLSNYAFHNRGGFDFQDVTEAWGLKIPSFSNGGAYADLDNDGDLDMVTNNINDPAFLYENTLQKPENQGKVNYLRIGFAGEKPNLAGIGTKLTVYADSQLFYYEHSPTRGYISTVEPFAHIGLGGATQADSLRVIWPDGRTQLLTQIPANQVLTLKQTEAQMGNFPAPRFPATALFQAVADEFGLRYQHTEKDVVDFYIQRTLPHKYSQMGPPLAVGDLNGDGLDDVVIGGSAGYATTIFYQNTSEKFAQIPTPTAFLADTLCEDMALLLFDADSDSDLDLYAGSGGYEHDAGSPAYQDRLYLNDGKGNWTKAADALPKAGESSCAVRAADFDGDGLLDLFVGGRVTPKAYPMPANSMILKNLGGKFEDVTAQVCPELARWGMVTDALWTDFDQDGKVDLLVAGEWQPLTFFRNEGGRFANVTAQTGIGAATGWWNSLAAADFDLDGDMDYVAGNLGLNTYLKASPERPVQVLAKDFDNSGSVDPVVSYFLKNNQGGTAAYPISTLNEMIAQMNYMRKRFPRYGIYANATVQDVFTDTERKDALALSATHMVSSYVENLGGGKFRMSALPLEAQFAPIYGLIAEDVNLDGLPDLVAVGNSHSPDVFTGHYRALPGLVLIGDGKGQFIAQNIAQSGFYVPGDAKGLAALYTNNGRQLWLASQNKGVLQVFENKQIGGNLGAVKFVRLLPGDAFAEIALADGRVYRQEAYYGQGYLSQSARVWVLGDQVRSVKITDFQGNTRQEDVMKWSSNLASLQMCCSKK